MTDLQIKKQMMNLWKINFQDSSDYISLIFDNYFNKKFIEWHEINGEIISALLGIPYNFVWGKYKMKGLYLCGLSTNKKYRNTGIMKTLISRINIKAKKLGFVFTFLIPANENLFKYYTNNLYNTSFYRAKLEYLFTSNFNLISLNKIYNSLDNYIGNLQQRYQLINVVKYDSSNEKIRQYIIDKIVNIEQHISTYISILHSPKDIGIIIDENKISNGEIFISYINEDVLTGIAFISIDPNKNIVINKIYYDDIPSFYKLLNHIKSKYHNSKITLFLYPEESCVNNVFEPNNNTLDPENKLSKAAGIIIQFKKQLTKYGMIRVLDVSQILKFMTGYRDDLKLSILIKDQIGITKYEISYGKLFINHNIRSDQIISNRNKVVSIPQLSELIFREEESNVPDKINIPRLPINMSLLLD